MITAINFLSVFLLMLVTGIFWGPWLALTRSLGVFNAGELIRVTKTLSANLGKPMRVMLPGCILFMILTMCIYPTKGSLGFYLGITAVILLIVALIVTVVVEVPIVKSIEQWDISTLPTDWMAKRDQWVKFHIVRVIASLAGFGCFVLSVLFLR